LNGADGGWGFHRRRLLNLRLRGGFTICQHIRYHEILPVCQRIGVDVVFSPHVDADQPCARMSFQNRLRRAFSASPRIRIPHATQLRPFPHVAVNAAQPSSVKDVSYSFIGADSHPIRRVIFELPKRRDSIVVERREWHFYGSAVEQATRREQYRQTLARSRYSLCPRGTGPSTIRFWESLAAGAIPVLISDQMALPPGFDWRRCVVRIPEVDVRRIEEVLDTIGPGVERSMRVAALEAFDCFSGDQFVSCIQQFYNTTSEAKPTEEKTRGHG
jgi:hypothetical protein